MSKHAWGAYIRFRGMPSLGGCTWCGGPLAAGVGVVDGRFIRDALICGPCGRLGVRCTCDRLGKDIKS
jgi:hypothetical protein